MCNVARLLLVLAVVTPAGVAGSVTDSVDTGRANPIRKVVTMLQMMANKVAAEGKKEEELFEQFMCYCKTGTSDLGKSIAENKAAVPQLQSEIEESTAAKAQAEVDLKAAQTGRAQAKEDGAKATALREKEAAAFAKQSAELKSYIGALSGAIAALEKGMAGGFLQTTAGSVLRRVVTASVKISDFDRDRLVAFLSGGGSSGYVPQSGEITGILKTMKDEFEADLADAEGTEADAKANYEGLMASLTKEIEAHTATIEAKTTLIGELAVKIIQMKNSLSDAEEALIEDGKFLADLEKNCSTKQKEWDERKRTRAEELTAIHETIKILNDDDALELFKKTLPSASLLQMKGRSDEVRHHALRILRGARHMSGPHNADLDLIALNLAGKAVDFTKVLKMIDDLVALLKKEQFDDDAKKEYCETQIDQGEDKVKELKKTIDNLELSIEDANEALKTLVSEIKSLQDGIAELDKQVAEATDIRKKENSEYTELMASDTAAKDLLHFAKNRLQKFYNPKLYKPPPKRELTEEERISTNMGGTLAPTAAPGGIAGTGVEVLAQVSAHAVTKRDAPAPPPATWDAYSKKSEQSGGVLSMIDMLVKDLDKEMQEATVEEQDAQKDYESMMRDSASKRVDDTKAIADKMKAKAATETKLAEDTDNKKATTSEFLATEQYLSILHSDCDWLMQHYDLRKEARASEVDSLKNAKAVLSGADFSFAQRGPVQRRLLRQARS